MAAAAHRHTALTVIALHPPCLRPRANPLSESPST